MRSGIVIIALGYNLYGSCAFNLAMSIKAYDPKVNITLLHDGGSISHLTESEKDLFDNSVLIPEEVYTIDGVKQYQYIKLCADQYSPYEYTAVIDADTIWFPDKKFSWWLGEKMNEEFWIGCHGFFDCKSGADYSNGNYTYWGKAKEIVKFHKLKGKMLQTVSGMFYFHKGEFSSRVFARAREIYKMPTPSSPWASGKPDEYCFNVALCELEYFQDRDLSFYFDKVSGAMQYDQIYANFWCLSNGGARCPQFVIQLYNKLVKKYVIRMGFRNLYFHQQKEEVIPERSADKAGVLAA
jgi:hypothetical protein